MKNKKTNITESVFRSLVRKEIKRMFEASEPEAEPKAEVEPEVKPAPPKEKPKVDKVDKSDETAKITADFSRKLKGVGIDDAALTDILTDIVNSFLSTSEEKLNLLKAVKQNTVH